MRTFFAFILVLAMSGAHGASLCDSGRNQSPIDIRTTRQTPLPALDFAYRSVPLKLANDGHTVRVRLNTAGALQIGQTRYRLDQFHFHTPAGDRIAGEEFPMAAHILHKSPSGQLLAVVVLFRLGAGNALLDKLLPLIPAKADGTHAVDGQSVSAAELLPAVKSYYRYTGSLTAAPCTEGVEWVVLKQPVELSAAQLARYKKLFSDNMRAPQPLNQRVVLASP
jgi:carbonic anhydrase